VVNIPAQPLTRAGARARARACARARV